MHRLALGLLKAPHNFPSDGSIRPPTHPLATPSHDTNKGRTPPDGGENATRATIDTRSTSSSSSGETRPPRSTAQAPRPSDNRTKTRIELDERLSLRLEQASPYRHAHPHELLRLARSALPPDTQIRSVQQVRSCIAIVPARPEDAPNLRQGSSVLARAFAASTVESADDWVKLTIPRIPSRIRTLTEDLTSTTLREVTEAELASKVTSAFGFCPAKVSWAAANEHYPNSRCGLVAFHQADAKRIPSHVVLFSTPLPVFVRPPKKKVTQCTQCFGFHRRELCTHQPRCPICSSPMHTVEEHSCDLSGRKPCLAPPGTCTCPPLCANCTGPHDARDLACPARPTIDNQTGAVSRVTRTQLRDLRRAGSRLRSLANTCTGGQPTQLGQGNTDSTSA